MDQLCLLDIVLEQTSTIVFEWATGEDRCQLPPVLSRLLAGSYDSRELLAIWSQDNVLHQDDRAGLEALWKHILAREQDHGELTVRLMERASRQLRWYRLSLTGLPGEGEEGNSPRQVICTLSDVDEATRSRQALQYRAEYDTLTGLPNAQGFYLRAQQLLGKTPGRRYAMLRVDINRFRLINDVYGMEEGDKLLRHIGIILEGNVTDQDACGRISGDVFGMLTQFSDKEQLIARVEQMGREISSYSLGHTVTPSFGICVVDDKTVPASILCDWAKLALDTVKGNLIRSWAFFDDNLRARQLDERSIESEMEQGLAEGQFVVYLQPKHNLRTGQVVGAEALVRWQHPREGLLAPWRFIPLFERNGFIIRLDEFVWEQTCAILRSWLDEGRTPVPISVNVSRTQVYNVGFAEKLIRLLQKYDLPAELLELELTESTLVENPEELYRSMTLLMEKGFSLSMDDFGSGYSSLNMLKNAPISTIKLDRGFLNETVVTARGQTVIQHTIAMANQLDLKVVAEGVETETQARFLLQAGCSVAQGFYFSRPMPVGEFNELVACGTNP